MSAPALNDFEVQSLRTLATSEAAQAAVHAKAAARTAERGRIVRTMLAKVTEHCAESKRKGDAAIQQRAEVERLQAELGAANQVLMKLTREAADAQNLVEHAHQQARFQLLGLGGQSIIDCVARVLSAEARNRASLSYRPTFDRLGHQTDSQPADPAQVAKGEELRRLAMEVANLEFSLLSPDLIEQRCAEIEATLDAPASTKH